MDELLFLRAEVSKLERFIEASAESRAAVARQAQQLQRNTRVCHECLETALVEVGSSLAWEALRADPPDLGQLGRAALLEMRGLAVDTSVLRSEMALVESERNAAREVEAYALSVARSYRGFASQGAARLDEVCILHAALRVSLRRSAPICARPPHFARTTHPAHPAHPAHPRPRPPRQVKGRLRTAHGRMQQQLDDVRGAALLALRRRALRSLVGLRCGLANPNP